MLSDGVGELAPMPQRFSTPGSSDPLVTPWRVLAYGDSLTAGFYDGGDRFAPYGASLASSLTPAVAAHIWVCGLSGLTVEEMVQEMDSKRITDCADRVGKGLRRIIMQNGPFDLVLVMAGTNDLPDREVSPASIATTIQALHMVCHKADVRTIALSVPPNEGKASSSTYRERWKRVNSLLRQWTQTVGTIFVDTEDLVPFSEDNGLWEEDGLHFSASGSRLLGERLAPIVAPVLQSAIPKQIPSADTPREMECIGKPMPQCCFSVPAEDGRKDVRRILTYGDSLTAGFHAFGKLFAPYAESLGTQLLPHVAAEIWVCGLSGVTAKAMAERIEDSQIVDVTKRNGMGLSRILQEKAPFDLVLIMAGTNDLSRSTPEEIAESISDLHSACHRLGVPSVALGVPPSHAASRSAKISKCRKTVNRFLSDMVKNTDSIRVFVNTSDLVPFHDDSELWEMDGLHLSPAGSAQLGSRLAPVVLEVLLNRSSREVARHEGA